MIILNRIDYDNMVYEILSDKSKFRELTCDPTLKQEGQLQRFLLKLKNKGYLMKLNIKKYIQRVQI